MIEVRRVGSNETDQLRSWVLRAGGPLPPDPGAARAYFVGAYDEGVLLGTGNVRSEPAPWAPDVPAWRLRGMATDPARRSEGVGGLVLAALVAHCQANGGGELWCNARTPARTFYARAGFTEVGQEWVDPEIGPHVQMRRTL